VQPPVLCGPARAATGRGLDGPGHGPRGDRLPDRRQALDGLVVAPSLRGRGLSAALLDDLCTRLAALGVKALLAHFAFRNIPLPGFRLDRRHGGLVRDLTADTEVTAELA